MAEEKAKKQERTDEKRQEKASDNCIDKQCPVHGTLKTRGRIFRGTIIRKFPRRIAIEFERIIYIKKYERYMKKKTRIHARLPDCLKQDIDIGDYVEIRECRPLSKIVHFVVVKKIKSIKEGK